MKSHSRHRLFIDFKVQGSLMLRCLAYWGAMLMTITVLLITWRSMSGPTKIFYEHFDELWYQYKLPFIVTLFMLPLFLFDIAKLTNRFVGPVIRLRRALREMANGEPISLIHFRAGDYWSEVADEFNAAAARVQMMENKIAKLEAELRAMDPVESEFVAEQKPPLRGNKPELKLVSL